MITKDEIPELLEAMVRHGGSFAHYLARAWQHADGINQQLLMENFGSLLEGYQQFVRTAPPGFYQSVE